LPQKIPSKLQRINRFIENGHNDYDRTSIADTLLFRLLTADIHPPDIQQINDAIWEVVKDAFKWSKKNQIELHLDPSNEEGNQIGKGALWLVAIYKGIEEKKQEYRNIKPDVSIVTGGTTRTEEVDEMSLKWKNLVEKFLINSFGKRQFRIGDGGGQWVLKRQYLNTISRSFFLKARETLLDRAWFRNINFSSLQAIESKLRYAVVQPNIFNAEQ